MDDKVEKTPGVLENEIRHLKGVLKHIRLRMHVMVSFSGRNFQEFGRREDAKTRSRSLVVLLQLRGKPKEIK